MQRDFLVVFASGLFVGIIFQCHAQSCELSELQKCMDDIRQVANSKDLMFSDLQSEMKLNARCMRLHQALDCVTSITNQCFDSNYKMQLQAVISGPRKLTEMICNENSNFRKRYLKHMPCLQKISKEKEVCSSKFLADEQTLVQQFLDHQERLRLGCCYFSRYRQCIASLVLFQCGKDAADVMHEAVEGAGGVLTGENCMEYTYDSEHCITDNMALSCFKNISSGYNECLSKYVKKMTIEQDLSSEEQLKQSCCNHDHYQHCLNRLLQSECAPEAESMVQEIINPVGRDVFQRQCPEDYSYDSQQCASSATSLYRTNFFALFSCSIFFIGLLKGFHV